MKYRVYQGHGRGDTNKHGFSKKKDALAFARSARKHNPKWISIKKVKG